MLVRKKGHELIIDRECLSIEDCLDKIGLHEMGVVLTSKIKVPCQVLYRSILLLPKNKYHENNAKELCVLFSKLPSYEESFFKSIFDALRTSKKIQCGNYTLVEIANLDKLIKKRRKEMLNNLDDLLNKREINIL
jgi:hypothetical protein